MRTLILAAIGASIATTASAADQQPICADRPSKSTGECTVPAGHFQVETGLIDWSRHRSDGVTGETASFGSSLFKYGVGGRADIELGITPLVTMRVRGGGSHEDHSSFGDTVVRVKYRLTRDDAPIDVAVDPFVKIPTANRHLGNGKVEGGLLVPMSAQLGKSPLTFSLDPELDLLADGDGHGRHAAMQQVANLGIAVNDKLSLSTELWAMWDWDPDGTGKQSSWDASAGYLVTRKVQLDAGANFGLNRQTPGVELYAGISALF